MLLAQHGETKQVGLCRSVRVNTGCVYMPSATYCALIKAGWRASSGQMGLTSYENHTHGVVRGDFLRAPEGMAEAWEAESAEFTAEVKALRVAAGLPVDFMWEVNIRGLVRSKGLTEAKGLLKKAKSGVKVKAVTA